MESKTSRPIIHNFKRPFAFFAVFAAIGIWRYIATGGVFYLLIFGYIGFSIALGAYLSETLSDAKKPWGRRITQLLVGLFMLGFLGFLANENMQMEGFFFYAAAGIFGGATLHYVIAKVVGPLHFGRGWCGWGCWTAMILDFMPWKVPARPRLKYWSGLRYVHFVVSAGLVLGLIFLYDYGPAEHSAAEFTWLLYGNAAYYVIAILLAAFLKDNRAFCKYVCPIPVTMKITSRFSLMKQQIDMDECTDCGECEENCPMDIQLLEYARREQRVLSTECVLCDTCVYVCPVDAIKTTKRFDVCTREFINVG
ncbi:MAG: 4Fe-4S binding protein [candidate division Zixibacteria bacterium]|nr:4Fe-4S binding protein [candidate division Zixibacteria bacterium]